MLSFRAVSLVEGLATHHVFWNDKNQGSQLRINMEKSPKTRAHLGFLLGQLILRERTVKSIVAERFHAHLGIDCVDSSP